MVDFAQCLGTLSTRPPTPPKERNDPIIATSSPNGYFARVTGQILLDTPNESPSSSAEYFAGSSGKGTKKVEFSPWPQFHKPIVLGPCNPGSDGNIRRLPPSRDCKSSKSILKETFRSSPLAELPALDANNFPKMLKSATLHLRSASRSSRLDAYSALLGCMGAYDDVPETEALLESLPDFVEFIRRDMCAKAGLDGALDTQLISQSLKLLIVFLCTSKLADALPDDFRVYILDVSIGNLEDFSLPKILVTHHMQVLFKQNFGGKHITHERVNRLLSALEGLTDHQKGNNIIGLRLKIYQRLLSQAKLSLIAHAEHWIDHLISGILSTTKDIRALAINFGIEAGTELGSTSSVSQACFDLFARKSPEGQTVVDFLAVRLAAMTASKDDSVHVPQIWSVIILLLRNRRHKLERWLHLKPWLMVLQKCFNSNEAHTKLLAMTAWNRLVFVIELDPSTGPSMIRMLRQPIVAQLTRKGGDKQSKQSKQIAQSSYCNLLYYAFRPSATHAQLDLYWDQYIDQVIPAVFTNTKRDVDRACEIMTALLYNEQFRSWDENRANVSSFIKPDELPSLDPKWVRSRSDKVLSVFRKLAHVAAWRSCEKDKPPLVLAWRSFTKSLGDAGKQEVKVSAETMSAMAQILNMLGLFWDEVYVQQPDLPSTEFATAIHKLHSLAQEAIIHIGSIPFNEQRLLQNSHDRFEAAETPSSRSVRHEGILCSPTVHLLRLLVSSIADSAPVEQYKPMVRNLLEVALGSASSRRSQLGILREITSLIFSGDSPCFCSRTTLWCLIAEAAESALGRSRLSDVNSDSPQYAGHEYRDVVKILETGVCHLSANIPSNWQSLFTVCCRVLREEVGDGGVTLMMIEPLSDALKHQFSTSFGESLLACSAAVIRSATWPRSQQTLDRARKLLWGLSAAGQKPSLSHPFNKLYLMVERGLQKAYEEHASTSLSFVTNFLCAIESLLSSAPFTARSAILIHIQRGVAYWIEDQRGFLAGFTAGSDLEKVYSTVQGLWAVCKAAVQTLPYTKASLAQFEAFMISSLSSRHRSILNDAIALWNGTFGTAETLEYSENLRKVLLRLKKVTELQLPTFPQEADSEVTSSPFDFVESQNSQEDREQERLLTPSKLPNARPKLQAEVSPARPVSSPRLHAVSSGSQSLRRTVADRISKTPPKARFRHDDSQILFAAIDSPPIAAEEIESQLLTDHQKEIKERQNQDAAMFAKLGSSPPSDIRQNSREFPRLILRGSNQSRGEVELDQKISPTLPIIDGNLEAFLGSSPTPRSNRNVYADPPSDNGPPSSPPGLPSLADMFPKQTQPDLPPADAENDLHMNEDQDLKAETLHQTRTFEETDRHIVASDPQEMAPLILDPKAHGMSEEATATASDAEVHMLSDFDVFVDAPTEPLPDHVLAGGDGNKEQSAFIVPSSPEPPLSSAPNDGLRLEGNPPQRKMDGKVENPPFETEDWTSHILDSFLSQSSQYSNDDEQITAQLAVDMERASSQAEVTRAHLQAKDSTKKRKRRGSAPSGTVKRLRSSSRGQNCQVVIETERPDINKDDYVMVESGSASSSPRRLSPSIEQGRSTSLSDPVRVTSDALLLNDGLRGPLQRLVAQNLSVQPTTPIASSKQPPPGQGLRSKEQGVEDGIGKETVNRRSARRSRESKNQDQALQGDGQNSLAIQAPRAQRTQTASSQASDVPSPSPRKSAYRRLMDGFRSLLGEVRQVTLRPEEERTVTGVLFESILEVHEAGKRHPRS